MREKLFILDLMSLVYRGYFGMVNSPRYTSNGFNTSAIFGFTNILFRIINQNKPKYILAAMDSRAPTFRHNMSCEYKKTRNRQPEEISLALPIIKELLDALDIKMIQESGVEADDIIGSLSNNIKNDNLDLYIVSPDKDLQQLIDNDNKFIYKISNSSKNKDEILTIGDIKKFWEIETSSQIIDILALTGDVADNITGAPGIGIVSAKKLIKEYGSLEEILKNKDQLPKKYKNILYDFEQSVIMAKSLVTIKTNLNISYNLNDYLYSDFKNSKLKDFFERLEFNSLLKKYFFDQKILQNAHSTIVLYIHEFFKDCLSNNSQDGYVIKFLSDDIVSNFLEKSAKETALFLDFRKINFEGRLELFLIIVSQNFSLSVPVFFNDRIQKQILVFLNSPKICKVFFRVKDTMHLISHYQLAINAPFFDLSIAETLSNSFDYLASTQEIESNFFECIKKNLDGYNRFINAKKKLIEKNLESLCYSIEFKIIEILFLMEFNGVHINLKELRTLEKVLVNELNDKEKIIYNLANEQFNINSAKSVAEVLFDKLKIHDLKKKLNKDTSTNKNILLSLVRQHPIVSEIISYREHKKMLSTYVHGLIDKSVNDTIYTTYNQTKVLSGRLSSNNPNLQNLPRTEKNDIRSIFSSRFLNGKIVSMDYSQIELRVVASLSNDLGLINAFLSGEDIHISTAKRIFNLAVNDVITSVMRNQAKTINFGVLYGMSSYGLSKNLNISVKQAEEFISLYFQTYPMLKVYFNNIVAQAKKNGYVSTFCGRFCYLPNISSANSVLRSTAERLAMNFPVQGTAAELIKVAMIKVHNFIKEKKLKSLMIMQIHDELVFDFVYEELQYLSMIKQLIENENFLKIPIVVNVKVGENFGALKKV